MSYQLPDNQKEIYYKLTPYGRGDISSAPDRGTATRSCGTRSFSVPWTRRQWMWSCGS